MISCSLLLILADLVMQGSSSSISVGCFLASSSSGVLRHRALEDSELTHEKCLSACNKRTYKYFGLLGGDKCFCGNALYEPSSVSNDICAWKCGGDGSQECGSDLGINIFYVAQKSSHWRSLTAASGSVPLFAIAAHSGLNSLVEFDRPSSTELPPNGVLPSLFRSSLLDNLPAAIRKYSAKRIVAEMQKGGKMVTKVEFDVSYGIDSLDRHNWFTLSRVVKSFPDLSKSSASDFDSFSIRGAWHSSDERRFYIHYKHGYCEGDLGFMGIGQNSHDSCKWVTNGGSPPVLFYTVTHGGSIYNKTPGYADKFFIYMI